MNITRYRNTLIAAAVAVSLGAGATACSKPETSSTDARSDAADARSNTADTRSNTADASTNTATNADTRSNTADGRSTSSSGDMTAMRNTGDDAQDAMSDTWITTKVKALMLADDDAKGFDVDVETRNGVVILQGALQDQTAVDHVRQIAAGVEGVKRVDATGLTAGDQR